MTIPNTRSCTVSGVMADGAICAESLTDKTGEMNLDEFVEFLEPQPERPDPKGQDGKPHKCGDTETLKPCLPARAGAVCRSAEDESKLKDALEKACRELGSRCSYEVQEAIERMK